MPGGVIDICRGLPLGLTRIPEVHCVECPELRKRNQARLRRGRSVKVPSENLVTVLHTALQDHRKLT
jgi:hypothetical protein